MSLRDQIIADLPTFLNVGEFADVVIIDGDQMNCMLVNDEEPGPPNDDGVSVLESKLYARVSDFYKVPAVRQRVTVRQGVDNNDRQANITRVDEEQGMYIIRLQWFNS